MSDAALTIQDAAAQLERLGALKTFQEMAETMERAEAAAADVERKHDALKRQMELARLRTKVDKLLAPRRTERSLP